jgi:hypothetical protein
MSKKPAIYIKNSLTQLKRLTKLDFYDVVDYIEEKKKNPLEFPNGFYLRDTLSIKNLPEGSKVILVINKDNIKDFISFPVSLRGCLFEKGKNYPEGFVESLKRWNKIEKAPDENSRYFQSELHKIDIGIEETTRKHKGRIIDVNKAQDNLLAEGLCAKFCIEINRIPIGVNPYDSFVEIQLPIDKRLLWTDDEAENISCDYAIDLLYPSYENGEIKESSLETVEFNFDSERIEIFYIKVEDIINSPVPNEIYMDLLDYQMIDYGYYY